MGHTPGPWHVSARGGMAAAHYGKFCVNASHYGRPGVVDGRDCVCDQIGGPHADANARLIAAAPELADALRALVALADRGLVQQRNGEINAARAALAKVEG